MKKVVVTLIFLTLTIFSVRSTLAKGYPWREHASPFDFLFGNHIDTHQQSKLVGKDQLKGFFYIKFTGNFQDGYPEATHADCTKVPDECTVGWTLHGVRIQAMLLENEPGQHPIWYVDSDDVPNQPGYTHFHWLGGPEHAHDLTVGEVYDGYLLKLTAVDTFFFQHHGGFLVTPGIDDITHANIVTD
jgi:hypothetical protein